MPEAFYVPLGPEVFRATSATEGPWNPAFQHGGPPTALLVRQLERCGPMPDALLARVTAEFLAPVPVADLETSARVVRGGRNVQLLEAELRSDGRVVLRATAWRLRRTGETAPATGDEVPPPFGGVVIPSPVAVDFGYGRALEWRLVKGTADGPGPATVWARLRAPVVAGEEPSSVQRVVAAADSGSGVSAVLDWQRWSFVNVDLSVHLARRPRGEWICLDARTQVDPAGAGLATTTLYDRAGRCGTAAQTLLVARRT